MDQTIKFAKYYPCCTEIFSKKWRFCMSRLQTWHPAIAWSRLSARLSVILPARKLLVAPGEDGVAGEKPICAAICISFK